MPLKYKGNRAGLETLLRSRAVETVVDTSRLTSSIASWPTEVKIYGEKFSFLKYNGLINLSLPLKFNYYKANTNKDILSFIYKVKILH